MSKGDIDLLMVGDSITHNFENEKVGLKVWEKYFVPLKAINLGFGGDRTEHVLWRLDHLPVMKKAREAKKLSRTVTAFRFSGYGERESLFSADVGP